MTSPDVAQIVRGLTKAQRELLVLAPRTAADSYSPARRLQSLGLADWRRGAYGNTYRLTPLGQQVRAAITGEGM